MTGIDQPDNSSEKHQGTSERRARVENGAAIQADAATAYKDRATSHLREGVDDRAIPERCLCTSTHGDGTPAAARTAVGKRYGGELEPCATSHVEHSRLFSRIEDRAVLHQLEVDSSDHQRRAIQCEDSPLMDVDRKVGRWWGVLDRHTQLG